MAEKLKIEKKQYVNKTFRLSKDLVSEMEKICNDKNISLNQLVDTCIRYALSNLDDSSDT